MQAIMEAHPYQLESITMDDWKGETAQAVNSGDDDRRLRDSDYETASRIVKDWLGACELRTMYPNELAALKFLLGRI